MESHAVESPQLARGDDALPAFHVHCRVARQWKPAAIVRGANFERRSVQEHVFTVVLDLAQAERYIALVGDAGPS